MFFSKCGFLLIIKFILTFSLSRFILENYIKKKYLIVHRTFKQIFTNLK
ncbi:hypothetical protein HMPREF9096_01749 [Haemophilus sp. oral taxon 851 str. F0397]|nr:hypothetical protein HMPREF9096_01749 [Haemophilus sp. oral taxon 851 str. F0397]